MQAAQWRSLTGCPSTTRRASVARDREQERQSNAMLVRDQQTLAAEIVQSAEANRKLSAAISQGMHQVLVQALNPLHGLHNALRRDSGTWRRDVRGEEHQLSRLRPQFRAATHGLRFCVVACVSVCKA